MSKRMAALVAASATLLSLGLTADPASAETRTVYGCPAGAVCIYSPQEWANDTPGAVYYNYGYNAVYNQYGWKYVFNNQYQTSSGRAAAFACDEVGYCPWKIMQDEAVRVYMDPINFVRLDSSGG